MRSLQFLWAITETHLPNYMEPCNEVYFINSFWVENYIKRPYTLVLKQEQVYFCWKNSRDESGFFGFYMPFRSQSIVLICNK